MLPGNIYGVDRHTVARWHLRQQQNNVRDLPRSGRPRITTAQQDRFIRLQHPRNRFQPATLTAQTIPGLRPICSRVVRNRLWKHRIQPRRPARRTVLKPRHRVARLAWCRQHLRLNQRQWGQVLFSDESRFQLFHHDG